MRRCIYFILILLAFLTLQAQPSDAGFGKLSEIIKALFGLGSQISAPSKIFREGAKINSALEFTIRDTKGFIELAARIGGVQPLIPRGRPLHMADIERVLPDDEMRIAFRR
jgi:hypothetical protein